MHQKRVCEYFQLPCRHTRSFLDLSPPTRRLVYEAAGLFVGVDVILRRRPRLQIHEKRTKEDDVYSFIYAILQTSRTIHDEVKYIICAENRIVVHHQSVDYGLHYLSRLSPHICSGLQNVYIHLYLIQPPDPWTDYFQGSRTLKRASIDAWRSAITWLLNHANPQTLRLSLICDTGDCERTHKILQPLRDHPGSVANCQIRLYPLRDERICAIAEQVVLRAKGLEPNVREQPFRFMSLPAELRLRILRFTDLVTPMNEVQWSPEKGFHITFSSHCWLYGEDECPCGMDYYHAAEKFRYCNPNHSEITGSFCSRSQSCYSHRCLCWLPPRSIFLVSHGMYQHAIEVLYSCNRVTVLPDPDAATSFVQSARLGKRLSVSRFITRHMQPTTLAYLRSLELVLPGMGTHSFCPRHPDPPFDDWCFAVDHLRAHANLAALTLTVYLRLHFGQSQCYVRVIDNRLPFTRYWTACRSDMDDILQPHTSFLRPLEKLREHGLRRFFIHLEWDWHWSGQGSAAHGSRENRDDIENQVDEMESRLEKEVMGEGYDSHAVGKGARYPSQWMLDYE